MTARYGRSPQQMQMAPRAERVPHAAEGLQEPLRRRHRLEPTHHPLPHAGRLVRLLHAVVAPHRSADLRKVQLTPDDLRDIEAAFAKVTVHGGRMNPMQMEVVDG